MKWILLIAGGATGTLARYAVSGGMHRIFGSHFPFGTMTVNLTGCFLVGMMAAFLQGEASLTSGSKLFLMVGFCGAFTTFSTFILETSDLIHAGQTFNAFLKVTVSVAIGFFLFRAGLLVGDSF